MFEPNQIAASLPSGYSRRGALVFALINYGIFGLASTTLGALGGFLLWFDCIRVGTIAAACCWLTQTVVAAWLALVAPPGFAGSGYRLWRGVMHYMSHAFTLTTTGLLVVLWYTPRGRALWPVATAMLSLIGGLVLFALALWWSMVWPGIVAARARTSPWRGAAAASLPLLVAASAAGSAALIREIERAW